jgi:phosphoribosylglycinamide formyltransferase 1
MGIFNMLRLGILGSTRGTDMLALIAAIRQKKLDASIETVISNRPSAIILERAKAHEIATQFIDPKDLTREEYDEKLSTYLRECQVDVIVLIGYMRILSDSFVHEWRNKVINVHPSLLPAFAGGMDQNVHQAVLDSGIKQTGCTVHFVTEKVDGGAIIMQKTCEVLPDDSPETLKDRVQALEGVALVESISLLAEKIFPTIKI